MNNSMPLLLDENVTNFDKMRIIILYVISKNGLSEESLNKIVHHAQLSPEEKQAIINLSLLGCNPVVRILINLFYQKLLMNYLKKCEQYIFLIAE